MLIQKNTDNKRSVRNDTLEDGTYTAEFDTDSGMFHVNEASNGKNHTVKDGKMTIHVSLASKKGVNLFVEAECRKEWGRRFLNDTDTVQPQRWNE